jgi:hypothetical protein
MDWGALVGGFIGAGIPASLAYVGLRRGRQAADAEAFGPAVRLLYRLDPVRVTFNMNPDRSREQEKWADLQQQLDAASERLLIVSAGNPRRHVRKLARSAEVKLATAYQRSSFAVQDMLDNRNNPEWLEEAQCAHAEAMAAMDDLINANFGWPVLGRPLRWLTHLARRLGRRLAHTARGLGLRLAPKIRGLGERLPRRRRNADTPKPLAESGEGSEERTES